MREDTDINPDVLGYIFEKYINQKELGAYYTKGDITGYISKNTIIPFILDKLRRSGFEAPDPNPMITNNEDIIGSIADYLEWLQDYDTLKFLYKDVLVPLSVLDPAVGSGAFLFTAPEFHIFPHRSHYTTRRNCIDPYIVSALRHL